VPINGRFGLYLITSICHVQKELGPHFLWLRGRELATCAANARQTVLAKIDMLELSEGLAEVLCQHFKYCVLLFCLSYLVAICVS
jgi:hypothetical protein